jgi:hypothetical protein
MRTASPELSVVLVTGDRFKSLRRTVRHLRQQTVCDRIELLIVGPDETSFRDLEPEAVAGFAGWRTIAAGPMREVERAHAVGILAASAPVVALLENHVYPDPEWAGAILRAHEGPWAAVGSIIRNANPATAASWVEHFFSYGFDDESASGGEVARVSRNNSTFKRALLTALGDRLGDVLARDGGLFEELQGRGHRFYLEPEARMQHLNTSLVGATLTLRWLSARAAAATRARTGNWSRARRLLYVAASPIFPLLRVRALWPRLRSHPARHVLPRIAPLFAVALVVDAFGQALGFALGPGDSAERAGRFDLFREPYLCAADRARFAE